MIIDYFVCVSYNLYVYNDDDDDEQEVHSLIEASKINTKAIMD